MRIVIIEDEMFAARRLENMILKYDPDIDIAAVLESVKDSIAWFRSNKEPDLIFLDLHLDDDLSFSIFREVSITSPIVFTTATDEIATRAFILNKIDFLHKPIMQNDLTAIISKYSRQPKSYTHIDPDFFNDIANKNS